MRARDDELWLSPTDVNNFLACRHLPALDLLRARGQLRQDKPPRPDAELIAERGRIHEQRFLEELEASAREVLRIPDGIPLTEAAALSEEAMRNGVDCIHQAAFVDGHWRGFADFLLRVEAPSELGDYSYEAYDAKLATHPKPYFIHQLVFYTEQIGRIQGWMPDRMYLVLGNQEQPSFRTTDFTAYTRRVRDEYIAYLASLDADLEPPYPYPVEHCAYCDWWARCRDKRRADDHLSLVAFLARGQAIKLEAAGVRTVEELAALPPESTVPRLARKTVAGLQQQARLQVEARRTGELQHEFLQPEFGRGFARLPEPSAGDVFFDIEGDPYWGDEGLEYLLGNVTEDGTYRLYWAHDRREEQEAFEQWIDWIRARLREFPDLHIYHYNAYEPVAIKKLMARYGSRESEVDELLRRKVFVDLYGVVRQAMRIGKESYSLKSVEDFYAFTRDTEVTEAGGSILAYQEYLESRDQAKLDAIAAYNADDCRSTLGLRDWLLQERAGAEAAWGCEIAALAAAPASPVTEQKQTL
ncbi:MAG: hypothetical protein QOK07_3365, partial [Gemmatimonadaceae bacterium]|nr:hypothetical protein [Gemmatimonadaceae bacterium]